MYVLATYKNEEDQIKIEAVTTFYIYVLYAQGQLTT